MIPNCSFISVPNNKMIQKKAGKQIDAFKDMVFPEGYVPGAKRKVPPGIFRPSATVSRIGL